MRPIRLAVIFDQKISFGGGYQQALNAALLTRELPSDLVETKFFTTVEENIEALVSYRVNAIYIRISFFSRVRSYFRRCIRHPKGLRLIKAFERYEPFERSLIEMEIDLVYFLSPSELAQNLEQLNYITTVWDLCHRDCPEFPEVKWDRQFEIRDDNYRAILPRAVGILVDSSLGKQNVIRRYGIDEERVHVMPFQAAPSARLNKYNHITVADVRQKYGLEVPYVYYPAQFWAHKNHVYVLEGLKDLENQRGIRIGAIFSGGDMGNLEYVRDYASNLGLNDRVRFAGFVSNEEVRDIYQQSIALVMPTYFGPTNLPVLEAFELGVPALYSDVKGMRDQVGDAALLLDLKNPSSMVAHLAMLMKDEEFRNRLVANGKERLKYFDKTNRAEILKSIIEDFRWRRICWK